ncbi:MAG: pyrimidine-nucleoside phosphorylase, partial [Verrucomicrobiae bacterium]|nr:pyrimidine-nucleoside phosphorylase [Verrucomicrobiae bacterium]
LEVQEAIDTLKGRGPEDLVLITLDLAEEVATAPREQLEQWLNDGTAWAKFVALVEAQGGDATCLDRYASVHPAPVIREVAAEQSGTVTRLDAGLIGFASLELGAGRSRAEDAVDVAVGFSRLAKCGDRLIEGQPVGMIHARSESDADLAERRMREALTIRA